MEIRWLGHSAFEIITEEGLNILIDPFIIIMMGIMLW